MLRRDILKGGLAVACAMITGTAAPLALANPVVNGPSPVQRASMKLAMALRTIGSDICTDAARRLEANGDGNRDINLHLRRAGLSTANIELTARAMRALKREEASSLVSLSLSYNLEIGDTGALFIAQSLPVTLSELGLVGCEIGDQGGEALLDWAGRAFKLRMICVEDNRFSEHMKIRFVELARRNKNILVVV